MAPFRWLAMLWLLLASPVVLADDVYQQPKDFLSATFPDGVPAPEFVWLTRDVRADIKSILGHGYGALRIRYWGRGARTAWIIEEIGKYKPITTGLVVAGGRIERVKVLIYRESHGWEVRHPFFTDQFKGAGLREGYRLTEDIDGISGATLSVNALRRLTRLALYLHRRTPHAKD